MLNFDLITPEKVAISQEVYEVILPTENGQIAVLPGHIPLVTVLKPGVISIRRQKGDPDDKLEHLATSGGFAEVTSASIKVMADTADRADDISELKIQEAKEEAKQQVAAARDDISYADAISRLEFELAREKVRGLKHRHRVD